MLFQQIINGLTLGMTYAIIAIGYSLVFGILRLVNFSHGSVYAFGANIVLYFITLNFGVLPAIFVGAILTGILGILIDKSALEPLRNENAPKISALVTTIGISNIVVNLMTVYFGSQKRPFPSIFPLGELNFGNFSITYTQVGMLLVSLILVLLLVVILTKTKIGLAMKAVEQNTKAAKLMGINVNFIISFTFFIGALSASVAGVLVSSYYNMAYANMGNVAGLKAFAAAVLGGIGSLPGSLVGGLLVGISESLAVVLLGSQFRDSVAFVMLILVLIIKPNGLFGKAKVKKV